MEMSTNYIRWLFAATGSKALAAIVAALEMKQKLAGFTIHVGATIGRNGPAAGICTLPAIGAARQTVTVGNNGIHDIRRAIY